MFVKAHGGTGCNKGLMQSTLTAASFLERTVRLKRNSDRKFTFYLSLFKKSPGHH